MKLWLIIIASGVVTFLTRASFLVFGDKLAIPAPIERALKYVAPAAFAAISIPLVFGGDGLANIGEDLPRVIAAAAAAGVVAWKKNLPLMLVVGMTVFWLTRSL